jgi:hypothetical protein
MPLTLDNKISTLRPTQQSTNMLMQPPYTYRTSMLKFNPNHIPWLANAVEEALTCLPSFCWLTEALETPGVCCQQLHTTPHTTSSTGRLSKRHTERCGMHHPCRETDPPSSGIKPKKQLGKPATNSTCHECNSCHIWALLPTHTPALVPLLHRGSLTLLVLHLPAVPLQGRCV